MPVLASERIGGTGQELADRVLQFVRGQEYSAQVLSKISDTVYRVKVENTILQMELGSAGRLGQTLSLQYMPEGDVPTFLLSTSSDKNTKAIPDLVSATVKNTKVASDLTPVALLVGHLVKEIEGKQGSARREFVTLIKGQEYLAQVESKVSDTLYNVKVGGNVIQMELGSSARAGQSLLLQYVQENPASTFLFAPAAGKNAGNTTDLSLAAHLIGHYLKEAEDEGVPVRYEAATVVTHSPKNPQIIAHDLKQAVSNSGLFYESHLSELVQGSRTVAAVMQEPQNQGGTSIAALMSQQLAILENKHMAWRGEVWAGQQMSWDVYLQQRDEKDGGSQRSSKERGNDEAGSISSEMILHLPRLGKVSAKLSLIDGRMRVNILAEQAQTLETFKIQRNALAEAIVKNGQQLDSLTLVRGDE